METVIQCITECGSANEARMYVRHYLTQEGCIGARMISDPRVKGSAYGVLKPFAAQAFFKSEKQLGELGTDDWLPDGCRYVLLPDSVRASLVRPQDADFLDIPTGRIERRADNVSGTSSVDVA